MTIVETMHYEKLKLRVNRSGLKVLPVKAKEEQEKREDNKYSEFDILFTYNIQLNMHCNSQLRDIKVSFEK